MSFYTAKDIICPPARSPSRMATAGKTPMDPVSASTRCAPALTVRGQEGQR